ncbi:hypothetical protein MMC07_006769 [Pseudocyphellaria aurata]|nr:hypothetical protein [Pseudocyphellaria aurata]
MSSEKAKRQVFVGNIPYGLSEEQIIEVLRSVGPVLSFRLLFDQETGKPKGYGFADFADADGAASAVRNLNNHEILGRQLRVDFSHVGGKDEAVPTGHSSQILQPAQPPSGYSPHPPSSGLPRLPPGADIPPGLTCTTAIDKTVSTLPTQQLLDILSQMKGLVMGDPITAIELLNQAPQLSYAIIQALLFLGLIDIEVLPSLLEPDSLPAALPLQPASSLPAPAFQPLSQVPYNQYPPIPTQKSSSTPPVPSQLYQPPLAQASPPPQQLPSKEELLTQVLAMTQEQIDQLQPTERDQIMALRQALMGQI